MRGRGRILLVRVPLDRVPLVRVPLDLFAAHAAPDLQ